MTLRRKISISAASVFSAILALACIIIYTTSAQYREDEFVKRLEDKALTTAKLLLEVKEVDKQLLKLIDQNSINKLFDEKILVFDDGFDLIYSSLDDARINWSSKDLAVLRKDPFFYRKEGLNEVVGVYYNYEDRDYFAIISAEDKYGNRKLEFLLYVLIITFLAGTVLVWLLTLFLVKTLLSPLSRFNEQIVRITGSKLNHRILESGNSDEMDTLTRTFNSMIGRIEQAFDTQKEFTANASHELRTPLTRIAFQIEGMLQNFEHKPEVKEYLVNIKSDIHHLSDIINSLLLLSKLEKEAEKLDFENVRIDEIIFMAYENLRKTNPEYELNFEIKEVDGAELILETKGIKSILQIAIANLLKNAFQYSSDHKSKVTIIHGQQSVEVLLENNGPILTNEEQKRLFESFMRGANSRKSTGYGLGLRMSKRILDFHEAALTYETEGADINRFRIRFKI